MSQGTAVIVSADASERKHFSDAFAFLDWTALPVESVADAIKGFTTSNADTVLVSENLAGMSILTALRTLCEVQPHVPVVMVLPDDRLADFGSLPSAGLLKRSAGMDEVEALVKALPEMRSGEHGAAVPSLPAVDMDFQAEERDGVAILKPGTRLDLVGHLELEERLYALAETGRDRIVLDLSDVEMLGSPSLAVLMRYWADQQTRGGRLVLARPSERAVAILKACNLDELFPILPSVEEAVQAVKGEKTASGRWKAAVPEA